MEYEIKCPCCGNQIKIQIGNDGEITVVSLINDKSILNDLDFGAIELTMKGGDKNG